MVLFNERKIISFNICRLWAICISRIWILIIKSRSHYTDCSKKRKIKKASHQFIFIFLLMMFHLHEIPPLIFADWILFFLQVPGSMQSVSPIASPMSIHYSSSEVPNMCFDISYCTYNLLVNVLWHFREMLYSPYHTLNCFWWIIHINHVLSHSV